MKLYNFKKYIFPLLILICSFSSDILAQNINNLWQPYRINPRADSINHINLSGIWELSYMDSPIHSLDELKNQKDSFKTQIPNSIQWSYYKAGKLAYPYAHKNSDQYQWMDEKVWYYKKEVMIPVTAKEKSIMLCFDGIDYFSKVWINDSLVGKHEGMFGGPVIDISNLVNYGEKNKIIVEVKAANWGNKKNFNPWNSKNIIMPWILSGGLGADCFFSLGMWQGVRIELLPKIHMERPYLTTLKVAKNKAHLHLSIEILAGINSLDKRLHPWKNAILHVPNGKKQFVKITDKINVSIEFSLGEKSVFSEIFPIEIDKGSNWLEKDIILTNPRLWNPNGLGDPNLYNVNIILKKNDVPIDHLNYNYGIRTIERLYSAGPRKADRWERWQFVINGKKIFVKGMNWMPLDVLLDSSEDHYRWVLETARNMGIQLIRIWGGGLLETDTFYKICDELGIMVWQDFPLGNQDTPDYPQDVWEAQVVQNIFRLRNHPSLAVWCGGNEINPYSFGNSATVGIIERNLNIFDNSRFFVRTTPDEGSMHAYPDIDPCWYNRSFKFEPWVAETGIHSMSNPDLAYELVDNKELLDLGKMLNKNFISTHPDFIHHFIEFQPNRLPRMLSRASHIDDISNPTIESLAEATQVGAGEFYQILSEKMQFNYPVTTGLMPWVFRRPWPVIAGVQLEDGFDQPLIPYYFLKRTYESTHVGIDLQRLLWAPGENIDLRSLIINANDDTLSGIISVTVFDDTFKTMYSQRKLINVKKGPSVTQTNFEEYKIPSSYRNRYLFILAELKNKKGILISRSFYYPRVLSQMENSKYHDKYVEEPVPWLELKKGPWLKPTVGKTHTKLKTELISYNFISSNRGNLQIKVTNTGKIPAFMTKLDITGIKRSFYTTDNFFWLSPGETKKIKMQVLWKEPIENKKATLTVNSWNTKSINIKFSTK